MKNKVIIIAEAGVNHNGDINLAKKLIDVAAEAKVDYVKFQTFNSNNLVSKFAEKATYQKENTRDENESQLEMLQKLELSKENHFELIEYCASKKIKFLSTAFDLESLDFLNQLNIDLFKIPSGEITNLPYLRKVSNFGKPVILSTGMATINEIEDALIILKKGNLQDQDISILHCNTEYPTPMKDVNLLAMQTIGETFKTNFGYSDHTLGIEIPIAAVALGASIIEKHFTIDKKLDGPDHIASLSPSELGEMVVSIRNIEKALGSKEKFTSESEKKNLTVSRKSIVASKTIQKGEIFTEKNITIKRPGTGISPMKWDTVIGLKAIKEFQEDELITIE